MKVMLLVAALAVSAALAGAVTYMASSRPVAAHELSANTPAWQIEVEFPDATIPFDGVEADLDGNASALTAAAWQ